MNGVLNRIFEIVLVLNLTGLFSFVGIGVGIPIAYMSAGILLFLLLYLTLHYRQLLWFLQKTDVVFWVLFAFAWPLATVVYAVDPGVRLHAINLYLVALMLATAIWLTRVDVHRAQRVFLAAALITVAGLALSLLRADFFQAVASAADARNAYYGRAFGFFLQPNMAAENMAFLYVLVMIAVGRQSVTMRYTATGIFLVSVLMTGSRGGMLISLALVFFVHIVAGDFRRRSALAKVGWNIGAIATVVLAVLAANQVARLTTSIAGAQATGSYNLTDRIDSIRSLDLRSNTSGSIAARTVALVEHSRGIASRPVHGFGLGGSSHHRDIGRLTHTSHNQYLQVAYDLGLPALAFFAYLLYRNWAAARRSAARWVYGCNPAMVLLLAFALACVFSNSVLNSRVFFATLGAVLAVRYVLVPRAQAMDEARV